MAQPSLENSEQTSTELCDAEIESLRTLRKDFEQLFLDMPWTSDLRLRSGSKIFKVHKCVLAARSTVFREMLMANVSLKEVEIQFPPEVAEKLLSYLYTARVGVTTVEDALSLYESALQYHLQDLERICVKCIQSKIKPEDADAVETVAQQNYDPALLMIAAAARAGNTKKNIKTGKSALSARRNSASRLPHRQKQRREAQKDFEDYCCEDQNSEDEEYMY